MLTVMYIVLFAVFKLSSNARKVKTPRMTISYARLATVYAQNFIVYEPRNYANTESFQETLYKSVNRISQNV